MQGQFVPCTCELPVFFRLNIYYLSGSFANNTFWLSIPKHRTPGAPSNFTFPNRFPSYRKFSSRRQHPGRSRAPFPLDSLIYPYPYAKVTKGFYSTLTNINIDSVLRHYVESPKSLLWDLSIDEQTGPA
jgi:hypothetical protein